MLLHTMQLLIYNSSGLQPPFEVAITISSTICHERALYNSVRGIRDQL